jgi:DMSO/TMAO reductase YedYZ molybdopterin-dependent catalytic subunit
MVARRISRRRFLAVGATVGGAAALAIYARGHGVSSSGALDGAETLTRNTQRFLLSPSSLAPEFTEADISTPRANGSTNPMEPQYVDLAAKNFVDWRLKVGGLVEQPSLYSLDDLRAMPSRTQITRHNCVEGWSYISKWKGVQLARVLDQVKLKPEARYIVFICADHVPGTVSFAGVYYESVDLEDAYHPQTILAYELNDQVLPIAHGAPVRVRVERQLGYKSAKYIMYAWAVDRLNALKTSGRGGFWEDYSRYEWYAGI